MMPLNLLLVRHGQSEANLARDMQRKGKVVPDGLLQTPDWQLHLTEKGRAQATLTGEWLRTHYGLSLDVGMVSAYVRARETAALLALGLNWRVNLRIIERDHGRHDHLDSDKQLEDKASGKSNPLFHRMGLGTGESLAGISNSSLWFLDALHREHQEQNVIAVCHGERIWDIMRELEKWTPETMAERMQDKSSRVFNCHIIHYSRVNPDNPEDVRNYFMWVRRICPCATKNHGNFPDTGWQEIQRRKYSDAELLDAVTAYPRFFA